MTCCVRGLRTCFWLLGCFGCTEPLIATVGVTHTDAAQESESGSAEPDAAEREADAKAPEDAGASVDAGGPRDAAPPVDADQPRDAEASDAEAGTGRPRHCIELPDVIFANAESDGGISQVELKGVRASLDSASACSADAQVNPQSTTYALVDGGPMLKPNTTYSLAWPLSIMVLVTPIVGSDDACDAGTDLGFVLAAFTNGCQEFVSIPGFKSLRLPFEPSTAPLGMALKLCESPCEPFP